MALLKRWPHVEFRDMYDFELQHMETEHGPGHGFTTTIRVDGLYRWGYSNGPAMKRRRESTDHDIYVTPGFILGSHDSAKHLFNWNTPPLAFWLYRGDVFSAEGHDLSAKDVQALANEATNKRRLQLEKAHALQAMTERLDEKPRRERIPQDVKIAVWQRDQGRCVDCGSQSNLEFDHVIPVAMGGSSTERNIQLLCEPCNRRKGATLG